MNKEFDKYKKYQKIKPDIGREQTNHWNIFKDAVVGEENLAM